MAFLKNLTTLSVHRDKISCVSMNYELKDCLIKGLQEKGKYSIRVLIYQVDKIVISDSRLSMLILTLCDNTNDVFFGRAIEIKNSIIDLFDINSSKKEEESYIRSLSIKNSIFNSLDFEFLDGKILNKDRIFSFSKK